MQRLIIALLLVVAVVMLLPGCFTSDARHNAYHVQVLQRDMHSIHENWDWFWRFDRPSTLHLSQDYWQMIERP